jgi:hypothetical protein
VKPRKEERKQDAKKEKKDLKEAIREERINDKRNEPMWAYDDPDEQWQAFREEARPIEREYLELRKALRDAEEALRAEPGDEHRNARVDYLRRRLSELEKQAPWLTSETPPEILLWGVPHG